MAQGERLTFLNGDVTTHTVTANLSGSDGRPFFDSGNVAPGAEAFVERSQFLTTGTYAFHCSIHPFMTGTLTVTAEGTPVPRPVDTTKPQVKVSFPAQRLAAIVKAKKVELTVTTSESAKGSVKVTAVVGKKTLVLGSAKFAFLGGTASTVKVKISSSALKALKSATSAKLTATGSASDPSGNLGTAKPAQRTVR